MSRHHRGLSAKERRRLRKAVYERDGAICWICGNAIDLTLPRFHEEAATMDHVLPISHGGRNTISNLRMAHRCCNAMRGNRAVVA